MRCIVLTILLCLCLILPCESKSVLDTTVPDSHITFIYHIPDEEEQDVNDETLQSVNKEQVEGIISDDITADTSGISDVEQEDVYYEEDEDYLISDLYTDVLKGYASYNETEDSEDVVTLAPDLELLTLNIKEPLVVKPSMYSSVKNDDWLFENIYTRFNGEEYSIAPLSWLHSDNLGYGLSTGTLYEQEISSGELEQSSGVFSKYEYKRFALTTSYTKTINTTNHNYNDKFALTPEFKLNQYITLKQKLSADTVKKRKKAEFILSINPFGKKDYDRIRFNFTVGETYDEISNSFWNRYEFNTTFKL